MKSIMAASDLSARADRALGRALELARSHGASLTVVHVIDEETPKEIANSLQSAATERLSSIVDNFDSSTDTNVSVRVVFGQAHWSIVNEAEAVGADLVVLGIHRNENSRFPVMGSTMERVVRESSVPVLVATRSVDGPYRRALVGVDFSAFTELALAAAEFLVREGAIHLVHVYHVPFAGFLSSSVSAEELRRAYDRDLSQVIEKGATAIRGDRKVGRHGECGFRTHSIEGEVRAVLRSQATAVDAELLVLGSGGRGSMARFWLGSVAEHFLVHPPCDVLVVKA